MEGLIQTQNLDLLKILHPEILGSCISPPQNMGGNFHRKMGQHKQFPVQQRLVHSLDSKLFSLKNNSQRFCVVLFQSYI